MNIDLVEKISLLRVTVGYLGERDQYGWWQSSFFTQGSNAFLLPLFGRTKLLGQSSGVTTAAALVHDERIGIGNVYHLFRLPEDLEQSVHQILQEPSFESKARNIFSSKNQALQHLGENKSTTDFSPGPLRIGKIDEIRIIKMWDRVAILYRQAFDNGQVIFPYFSNLRS